MNSFDMKEVEVYVCSVCKECASGCLDHGRYLEFKHPDAHCKESFDSNDDVTCHILNNHGVDKTVQKLRKQLTSRKTPSALRSREIVKKIKKATSDQDPKVRKHSKEFYCDICSYKTVYRSSYKRHLLRHEKDGRQHKCTYCPYAAIQKHNLQIHLKNVHPLGDVAPVIVDEGYVEKLRLLFSA